MYQNLKDANSAIEENLKEISLLRKQLKEVGDIGIEKAAQLTKELNLEQEAHKRTVNRLESERTELDELLAPIDLAIKEAAKKREKGFWIFGVFAWANLLNEVGMLAQKIIVWRNNRVAKRLGISDANGNHLPPSKRLNA